MNKSDYNLDLVENTVKTQHGDYAGYIQVDGYSGADLFKLCEDHGVDMDKYFLIGFTCGESTIDGIGKKDSVFCSALVLETKKYGSNYDEIKNNIDSKSGKTEATQISFQVKYSDFSKYIKRFDFAIVTKLTKHISELKITKTK